MIKNILRTKPGYQKKGIDWLSNKFNVSADEVKKAKQNLTNPLQTNRILLLDIETSPTKAYTWGIWNQNIPIAAILSDWFMITWVAKWYDEDTIYSSLLTSEEILNEDDSRITQDIHSLLDEATIVVTYNGDKFDIKKLNTRFLLHNLPPTTPFHSIDLYKQVKKNFGFTSNKMTYVNKQLGLTEKMDTGGYELWLECMKGNKESLSKMQAYCIQDVLILEEQYNRIKPWIKGHPNMTTTSGYSCPTCASDDTYKESVLPFGKTYKYEIYRCNSCYAISRSKKSVKDINQSNLTSL